jgi:hypothetical protein
MKKLKVCLAILISGLMLSCQNESVDINETESTQKELSKSALSTLKFLKEKGYVEKELKPNFEMNGFVHGDMVFPFEMYDNLQKNKVNQQSKNQYSGFRVVYGETNNMSYFIDSSFPSYYVAALDWAKYYWSISSPNIEIRRTFNRSEADIICSSYFDANDGAFARAAFPPGDGRVGNFLRINNRFGEFANTQRDKLVLMMHELGHNLGYEHSDQNVGVFTIPNTQTPAFHQSNACGSIMRSLISICAWDYNNVKNWSESDRNAIEWGFRFQ